MSRKADSKYNDFYSFEKKSFKKGELVRAVLGKYVQKKNPTYQELKEAFPDTLLKRYGLFQDVETATQISGSYQRYFMKEEQLIGLSDGTKVAVTNQLTRSNIVPFLERCDELGIKVQRVEHETQEA